MPGDPTAPVAPGDPGTPAATTPTEVPAGVPTTPGVAPTGEPPVDVPATEDPPPTLLGNVDFSVPSQSFRDALVVELSSSLTGEIRYTTDGTVPTAESTLYAGALNLEQTTELRAQVFSAGLPSGALSTALYVARDFDVTSDIPLLIVDGYGGGKPTDKETYRRAAFMLFEPVAGMASFTNLPTLASRSGHRLRGQSSASYEKTPYRVELWDNLDEDADYPILGMPPEGDWALIGPYVDRSLVRNAFVYDLGRAMGLDAPRLAYVEVYINQDAPVLTEQHYEGVYTIVETIKNAKSRLDLNQLKEDDPPDQDLSGGYIFSFEFKAVEGTRISCTGSEIFGRGVTGGINPDPVPRTTGHCWDDLELRDPDPSTPEQAAWITQYLQEFHDALHTTPIGPYGDYIEVSTFVDLFLLTEFVRNMDGYVRSAYFHKDMAGKLRAGPLWDYDLSLSTGGYFENLETAGWQLPNRRHTSDWFMALTQDPAFMALVSARWGELRQGIFSDAELSARLSAVSAPLANAAVHEFQRWPTTSIDTSLFQLPAGDTWESQLSAIDAWMPQRALWLDGAVGQPVVIPDYP